LVIRDKLAQARQAVAALGKRWKSLVRESRALQLEQSREGLARVRRGDRRVHLVIIASALCDYRASKEARQSKNGRYARASRYHRSHGTTGRRTGTGVRSDRAGTVLRHAAGGHGRRCIARGPRAGCAARLRTRAL